MALIILPKKAKEILGFPGYYATPDGDIWSGPKKYSPGYNKLKPIKSESGYLQVNLYKEGVSYTRTFHRLILQTFVGPCPEGLECRHLDGNAKNNELKNLCWGTHIENVADTIKHGNTAWGERQGNSKLNTMQIHIIRYLLNFPKEFTQREIAKLFGIAWSTIWKIKHGRIRKHE